MNEGAPMAEENHTPGPWSVWSRNKLCIEAPSGNVALCNLARNCEADARLIASAPDLLRALKAVVAISDRKHDAWDAAHAAIAKAEGRQPAEFEYPSEAAMIRDNGDPR